MSLNLGRPGVNQMLLFTMEELSKRIDLNLLNGLLQIIWKPLQMGPRRILSDKCSDTSAKNNSVYSNDDSLNFDNFSTHISNSVGYNCLDI